ncbi:hypothetical protein DSM104299_03911 [Baekduia alba]|uniref:hypothetical protein n=1 Tax=Baekduia alba TaxID=2997333 RepID=UPI0023417C01|nr:hypothetical protein [Baekduia alba]WCB95168.1 hypothetical protein DSM104299_03911 [Baekduia alba]
MTTNPMTPLTANVPRSHSDALVTHWYGWFFFVSSLFWPRLCIVVFWIFGQFMLDAFHHNWLIQVVGFLVLPWTTMAYALMWALTSHGVFGWEWLCVAAALFFDLLTYGEGRFLIGGLFRK